MEPHSRPCSSPNGTLRLPLALVLLLKTVFAGPTSGQVTQTVPDLARWQDIKNTPYHLLQLINPFAVRGDWTTSISVGMVKLTALCGIGSALWVWSRQGKAKTISSRNASDAAAGKMFPRISTLTSASRVALNHTVFH